MMKQEITFCDSLEEYEISLFVILQKIYFGYHVPSIHILLKIEMKK